MKRATRLAAIVAAVSTLGMGLILPMTASADDAATAVTQSATAQAVADQTDAAAADPIASFDFNADPAAQDNGTAAFTSAKGDAKATVNGTANLTAGKDDANGKAAQLGQNFWLNVTKSDGSPLLAGLNDVTISYDSKAAAAGGQWTVFAAPDANQVNGNAPTYLGVLDRTDKTRVERYLNGRNGDAATIDQNAGTAGDWKHVDLVISGTTAKLYVDRKFVASNVNGEELSTILGGSGGVLQIGKGNWGNGEYFTGLLDNLTIYGSALSAADLGVASPTKLHIGGSAVADDGTLTLKEGSSTALTTTVEPAAAEPTVTWASNNPAVATVDATGKVTGKKAGTATITATSTAAANVTASVKVTVTEVKPTDAYGYAMVHFIQNDKGYAEKIYLDITRGDDATQWDTLNGGEPILASNESTTGVRDPFIAYNPESKTYYILATDLRVFGGDNAGWGAWTTNYSTKLHVWSSKDLIHFSDMNELETATEDAYTKNPAKSTTLKDTVTGKEIKNIGMAWAPEATWVPNFYDLNDDGKLNGSDKSNPKDRQGGAFVVYWSVQAAYDGGDRADASKHVLWAATKDFTNATYQFGGVFVPNSKYNRGNTIDTTMLQRTMKDADGTEHLRSYRTTGSGSIFMEYTDRADWWRANDQGQYATDPAKGWVLRQTGIGHSLGNAQEGANGFKVNGQNKWYMFVDNYGGGTTAGARYGYNLLETDDLDAADGNVWKPVGNDGFFLTANTKHGGVVSLTKAQYDAIRNADAKASDNQNLAVSDEVTVKQNADTKDVTSKLPKTQQVTLSNGYGTADRDVAWDVSGVDTAKPGEYTVTGTVDTIGANKNHWQWTNAAGEAKTDEDGLINSGANANNNWKQTGGFVDNATAQKNRPLTSTTAITVTAKVKVEGDGTTDEQGLRAALAIPSRITGDLPSTVLGKTVTWKAAGDGAKLVASDGKVTPPTAGSAPVKVALTATIDGVATPVTADATILDDGGQIASYVKDVDRSDPNGAKYDPLAYNDDRRADSLYVADKAAGENAWTPLNRSHSILSVKWSNPKAATGSQQSAAPNAQMGSPTFYRAADGTLGVVASQNNATGAIYVWDGKGDGATFTNQRAITLSSSDTVTNPRIVYDAAAKGYKVFFTDGLTGEGRVAVLSDLTAKATVTGLYKADTVRMGVSGATDGLPAWAGEGQTSAFTVSQAEFAKFHKNYVDLQNTGVAVEGVKADVKDATAESIAKDVAKTKATMTYTDDSTKSFDVDWDTSSIAEQLANLDKKQGGEITVKGTVKQTDEAMYNDARADPDIFYNPDDGYYYLTGSTYEVASTDPNMAQKTSYRSIGLKRSKTVNGLKSAEEHIIIKPENGTPGHEDQYPNSFYGWSAFIWAQEFHKINGKWWIVAGFHKGASSVNGGWCNNTILIPYTGDEQSIKDGGFLEPKNWGEPTVLEGAAFDVTYFERTENGKTQGYWLQPSGAKLYVTKAKMGDGVTPLFDGSPKEVYSISQVFEYGKDMPTPLDDSEGKDYGVVEAPFMFEYGDYVYIAYAGGTVDKYYTTNILRASKDADLQDAASWTQVDFPTLDTNDTYTGKYGADETSYERKQAGPGHISLAKDESGNIVMAYHARPYPDPHAANRNLAGGLFDQDRNTWVKSVNVRSNGMLDMSLSKDQEVDPANRDVTVTVTVKGTGEGGGQTPVDPDKPGESVVTAVKVSGKRQLTVGDTTQLAAAVTWSGDAGDAAAAGLVWTSSDPTRASVDQNGVVTARAAGTVTITATAGNGFSGSLEIAVKAKPAPTPGKGDDAANGGLSATGSDVAVLLVIAALMTLAGGVTLALSRRRV